MASLLLACVAFTGCAAVGTHAHRPDSAHLKIAVLPPTGLEAGDGTGATAADAPRDDVPVLRFDPLRVFDPDTRKLVAPPADEAPDRDPTAEEAFQTRLVLALREQGAGTWVIAAKDQRDAVARGADVFVQPVLTRAAPATRKPVDATADSGTGTGPGTHEELAPPPDFAFKENTKQAFLGLIWWGMFGFGDIWTDDSNYEVKFDLYCDVGNARRLQAAFTRVNPGVNVIACDYWSRQSMSDWKFWAQLLWPAPSTFDNRHATSASLTHLYIDSVATNLAAFFREDYEWEALQHGDGSIHLLEANGPIGGYYEYDSRLGRQDRKADAGKLVVEVRRRGGPIEFLSAVFVPFDPGASEWPEQRIAETAPSYQRAKPSDPACDPDVAGPDGLYVWRDDIRLVDSDGAPLSAGTYAVLLSATGDREFSRSLLIRIR